MSQGRRGTDSQLIPVRDLLSTLGVRNKRELARLCGDTSQGAERRAAACSLVGDLNFRDAVPTLVRAVTDQHKEVSWAASRALGKIGGKGAVGPLSKIARQATSFVARQGALIALGRIGDPKAELTLTKILQDSREVPYVRGLAAQSLGMIHPSKSATPALIRALRDPDTEVRFSAICGLSATADPRAIAAILKHLGDHAEIPGEGKISDLAKTVLVTLEARILAKKMKRRQRSRRSPTKLRRNE